MYASFPSQHIPAFFLSPLFLVEFKTPCPTCVVSGELSERDGRHSI